MQDFVHQPEEAQKILESTAELQAARGSLGCSPRSQWAFFAPFGKALGA